MTCFAPFHYCGAPAQIASCGPTWHAAPHTSLTVTCRFPYPGQWGTIIFTWSSVLTMFAGAISAMVESLGDYYAGP